MNASTDDTAIRGLIDAYEAALNASDAAAAVAIFAEDGEFYPYNLPTATGPRELLATYEQIFTMIKLDIVFAIHEIAIDGNSAYAVTGSKGTVTALKTGTTAEEQSREVFVFTRQNHQWKVARYMFNKCTVPVCK